MFLPARRISALNLLGLVPLNDFSPAAISLAKNFRAATFAFDRPELCHQESLAQKPAYPIRHYDMPFCPF
jgi:hypothetical protein